MPDEPYFHVGWTPGVNVFEQLIYQMRPVSRNRETRIMTKTFDRANVVIVVELGEDRPICRCRKPVRVRKVQDVFQAAYPLFFNALSSVSSFTVDSPSH